MIAEVFAWPPERVPAGQMAHPGGAWAVLFGDKIAVSMLPEVVAPILKAEKFDFLVYVECVMGGSFAALCNRIAVESIAEA